MKRYDVAIVGITGLVGQTFLKVLKEYNFPINKLYLYASKKSEGKIVEFNNKQYNIIELREDKIIDVDIVFMSAGEKVSKEYAPIFEKRGALVIDNSSCWRNNEECALVVPEINMNSINNKRKIIANPNCSTIQCVLPLKVLKDNYGLSEVRYITYQAVSGSGTKGINDLQRGNLGQTMDFYPYDISKTCIPHIGDFLDNGYTKEEVKMINETKKILELPNLKISSTCVRVPIERGHGVVVYAKLKYKFSLVDIKEKLKEQKGIYVLDELDKNLYPNSIVAQDNDLIYIGRIRRDIIDNKSIIFYCVSDNIRKGAASNAVQIALKYLDINY